MDKVYQGSEIPRFTKVQRLSFHRERDAEEFDGENDEFGLPGYGGSDVRELDVWEGCVCRRRDSQDDAECKVLLFLSFKILTSCKIGQGGNQAIESAAVLTNCLLETINKTKNLTRKLIKH